MGKKAFLDTQKVIKTSKWHKGYTLKSLIPTESELEGCREFLS